MKILSRATNKRQKKKNFLHCWKFTRNVKFKWSSADRLKKFASKIIPGKWINIWCTQKVFLKRTRKKFTTFFSSNHKPHDNKFVKLFRRNMGQRGKVVGENTKCVYLNLTIFLSTFHWGQLKSFVLINCEEFVYENLHKSFYIGNFILTNVKVSDYNGM